MDLCKFEDGEMERIEIGNLQSYTVIKALGTQPVGCLPIAGLNLGYKVVVQLDTETQRLKRGTIARRVSPCSRLRNLETETKTETEMEMETGNSVIRTRGTQPAGYLPAAGLENSDMKQQTRRGEIGYPL